MSLSKDALKPELRSRLGDPTDAELPDTQLGYALDAALREFTRYKPKYGMVRLDIQKDVQDYPLPEGVTGVQDIWTQPTGLAMWDHLLDSNIYWLVLAGYEDKLQALGFTSFDDLAWDYDVVQRDGDTPLLSIWPSVQQVGIMLVRTEAPRDWASLGSSDLEAILLWARAECLEYIGRKRNKSVTRIPTAVGQLALDTGYTARQDGAAFKREFRAMLGAGTTVATR